MYQDIKYFQGLNSLRFFAAYLVVIHHAEQIRLKNGIFNLKGFSLFNNGGIAVSFFFVLSGFLITYLLMKEIQRTKKVSVRAFYVRRILRIWPLYFLLVIIGTILVPYFLTLIGHPYDFPYHFKDVILYYVFFSPFMVNVFFGHHLLEPLWSIGVEELFYIFWAPLFKFFKKHILTIILSVIIFKVILLLILPHLSLNPLIVQVVHLLQFEAMAIGGLAAYFVYNRKNQIEMSWVFSKAIQVFLITIILLRIFAFQFLTEKSAVLEFIFFDPLISSLLLSTLFAWLIVNISVNKDSVIKLNNKLFEFLGDISYGIYMYHMLIIFAIVLLYKNQLDQMGGMASTIVFYLVLTIGVVLVSYLSKRFFENRFLSLKSKFRVYHKHAKKQEDRTT